MTWDELEELRDRLSYILERERAEDGFCPIDEGYYVLYRQAARVREYFAKKEASK